MRETDTLRDILKTLSKGCKKGVERALSKPSVSAGVFSQKTQLTLSFLGSRKVSANHGAANLDDHPPAPKVVQESKCTWLPPTFPAILAIQLPHSDVQMQDGQVFCSGKFLSLLEYVGLRPI